MRVQDFTGHLEIKDMLKHKIISTPPNAYHILDERYDFEITGNGFKFYLKYYDN